MKNTMYVGITLFAVAAFRSRRTAQNWAAANCRGITDPLVVKVSIRRADSIVYAMYRLNELSQLVAKEEKEYFALPYEEQEATANFADVYRQEAKRWHDHAMALALNPAYMPEVN